MSDGSVKGTVEQVSSKEGNTHPKYGKSWRVGMKIEGEWYNAFTKKDADSLGLKEGCLVSFEYTENGDYKNFDPKSLKIAESGAKTTASSKGTTAAGSGTSTSTGGGSSYSGSGSGVVIGHAINNAVQLAIAQGKTDLPTIHGLAVDIVCLSIKLNSQYAQIVARAAKADKAATKAPAEEAEPGQPEESAEETPPPKDKKKAATTTKGKTAAATKAPTQQPPQDDAGGFEDDDIPF